MDHLLAKWIYPHFHNNHHPYAIRHQALFLFVVLVALTQIATNSMVGDPRVLSFATNITKADIISLTNNERVASGFLALKRNAILNQAAGLKADDMFSDDYWAHFAPDGVSPWHFFGEVGYKYTWAGENLARDFQTSGGVVAGWMASTAGHRENILNSNFTEIGVAVKNGVLQGEETTLVVQLFAKPVTYTASAPVSETEGSSGSKASIEDKLSLPASQTKDYVGEGTAKESPISQGVVRESQNTFNIVSMIENLSTSQKTSFGLLFVLGSLFVIDSATMFKRGRQRTNSHSGLHASVIFVLMITLIAQSVGSIL